MSGIQMEFAKKGNLGESVAEFFLSSIGMCTPFRRQDDIGVDFHCQLSDVHDGKYLSFHHPFMVQVKSNLDRGILYGDRDPEKWKHESTAWLFENKVPFFIATVDIGKMSMALYDTSGLWQVYNKDGYSPTQIELRAKKHPEGEQRENLESVPLKDWPVGLGDGFKHIVDLGKPVVEYKFTELDSRALMLNKKAMLVNVIVIEQKNIINRDLRLRVFTEIKQTEPPSNFLGFGTSFGAHPDLHVDSVLNELHDGLVSVLIKLNEEGRVDARDALQSFMRFVPRTRAAETLYRADPVLFNYLGVEGGPGSAGSTG